MVSREFTSTILRTTLCTINNILIKFIFLFDLFRNSLTEVVPDQSPQKEGNYFAI
jgi:hypothetical protein